MHDHETRVRKLLKKPSPEDVQILVKGRLEEGSVSRALALPTSRGLANLYQEAFRWLRLAEQVVYPPAGESAGSILGEILFSSRHIHLLLTDLLPFLERVEDNLGSQEDVTHTETKYEREVGHFSRLDSTKVWGDFLGGPAGLSTEVVSDGVRVEGDLMKVIYLEYRLRKEMPAPGILHAMMSEITLDVDRHLLPALEDGSAFLKGLRKAADTI